MNLTSLIQQRLQNLSPEETIKLYTRSIQEYQQISGQATSLQQQQALMNATQKLIWLRDILTERIRSAPWYIGSIYNPYETVPTPQVIEVYVGFSFQGWRHPSFGYVKKNAPWIERYRVTATQISSNDLPPELAMKIRDFLIGHSQAFVNFDIISGSPVPDIQITGENKTRLLIPTLIGDPTVNFPLYQVPPNTEGAITYPSPVYVDEYLQAYLEMWRQLISAGI